ncbi:uncharacterized protein LY79DRAFT_13114 [Colletotrichum navitas]|uniref:Uncharacterized protein n=1 Tax=Colletotrichum navitas TaxID=681940 RepID=A0AAD8QF58_9PEZI|nr:uncharacterized protein LY79DRAFT_13114 [Colletotrichum navitas]KAK1600282.1 hypothetical protein LY79DRAFT_13114 [Colletotrichum navitas]
MASSQCMPCSSSSAIPCSDLATKCQSLLLADIDLWMPQTHGLARHAPLPTLDGVRTAQPTLAVNRYMLWSPIPLRNAHGLDNDRQYERHLAKLAHRRTMLTCPVRPGASLEADGRTVQVQEDVVASRAFWIVIRPNLHITSNLNLLLPSHRDASYYSIQSIVFDNIRLPNSFDRRGLIRFLGIIGSCPNAKKPGHRLFLTEWVRYCCQSI